MRTKSRNHDTSGSRRGEENGDQHDYRESYSGWRQLQLFELVHHDNDFIAGDDNRIDHLEHDYFHPQPVGSGEF